LLRRAAPRNDHSRSTPTHDDEQKTPPPQIIFEDDDVLVIDKPAGLLTHARDEKLFDQEPTVVHWLIKKYPTIKKIGDKPELRPGIVHRLDKETSGVMIVAKTQIAFEHLKKQFSEHLIKKEYYGWAYGKMPSNYGIINFPIGRSEDGGKMAARPNTPITDEADKTAVTEYEVLKQLPNRALVKIMPQTGRTHQIRVHFFALNHPIIGDPIYQSKSYKAIPSERMLLHAHKLTFTDLAGGKKIFTSHLPDCFEK
jgi:23S rRNA pseudouridine1911/1915/1917 synthase